MRALAETIKRRRQLAPWRTLRALSMAPAVTSLAFQPLPAAAADAPEMLHRMEAARPDWLPHLDTCPADVMPARDTESGYFEGRCAATLEPCLGNCRAGDAADCYASAIILQKVKMENPISQALYLKAC